MQAHGSPGPNRSARFTCPKNPLHGATMPTRKSSATWEGGLKGGKGSFKGESGLSGTYSFGSRFENAPQSNPEELLAAALASCYSMALSLGLDRKSVV